MVRRWRADEPGTTERRNAKLIMKSKLKIVLVFFASLVLAFFVMVSLRPADFRVTRSATFAARPEVVFAQVNDLKKWNGWSPWAKLDPNAKNTFSGPSAGVGAGFAWAGNSEVGEGRMTITESKANEAILMKLEFVKPFEAVNTTEFTFKPEGNSTTVTWSMFGKNNFMSKAVDLFIDCDQMVGGQFEKGLADLKTIVEMNSAEKPSSK